MSDVDYPPVRTHAQALRSDHIKRGFLKCRLVHMKDRSFVMPDLLFSAKMRGEFFAARFFTGNQIAFFGGDGSADFCHLAVDLMNGTRVQVAFFRNDVVRTCRDGSVIYRCAFSPTGKKAMPQPCGKWRRRGRHSNCSYITIQIRRPKRGSGPAVNFGVRHGTFRGAKS